jgi:hypothetical protein
MVLLLEEVLRVGLWPRARAEVAFGEIDPGHAAWLVGQHASVSLTAPWRVEACIEHASSRRRCASGIIHSEASQLVLDRLFGARLVVSFICVSPFRKGNGIVYVMTHMSHAVSITSSRACENSNVFACFSN